MNRPLLPRRVAPATAVRTATSAPITTLRLNPFAAALRLGLLALSCTTLPAFAQTLPTNGTVAVGAVDIPAAVGNTLTLTQTTQFAQINWESFSIGAGDTLNITQEVSHFLLNNVVGNAGVVPMTNILGNLNAAGMVAIINRSGVMVGSTGVINVGGLIASSLNVGGIGSTNANNGPDSITFDTTGMAADARVVNDGTITAGAGGVTMLGRGVSNSGTITVADGARVQMVGTDGGTLGIPDDTAGQVRVIGLVAAPGEAGAAAAVAASTSEGVAAVVNSGTITAPGGTILLQASAAPGLLPLVNNTGLLVATGNATAINGGNVLLRGSNGSISSVDDGTANTGIRALAGTGGTDGTITASVTGAGSDLTVSGLDAGAGAVSLTAGGSIAGDTGRDVTGGALTIDSGGTTELDTEVSSVSGTGGTGVSITDESDLSVSSLVATTGNLSVATTSGALTVTSATANDTGTITLSAGGTGNDLNVGDVTTGSGSITLSAGDEIKEVAGGDADADVTTTGTLTATAATGINLQTDVGSLDGSVTGTGALVIDQIGSGLTLADVDTTNGALTVTADGTIVATDVAATGGDVSLTADSGNIDVASVSGPNVALIATNGAIQEVAVVDAGADVTSAGTLTAIAATGINLQTAVGSLDGSVTGTGALVIDQIGSGITLADVDTSDGALTVTADGTITATDVAASGGTASLTADSGNIDVASVSGPNVTLTSTAGAIQEVAGGDVDADVTSAGVLTATAATGINLQTDVGSLDGSVTGTGDLVIDQIGSGITLADIDTTNGALTVTADGTIVATDVAATGGNVSLTADSGNIRVASVTGPNVTLTSTAGNIQEVASTDAAADVTTTGTLTATAATGINLQTAVGSLDGTVTGTGALVIDQIGSGITLTDVDTSNGALTVTADGTIVATDVAATGGNVSLTADSGNIDVASVTGPNVTLTSTAGAIQEVVTGADAGADVSTAGTLTAIAATGINLQTAVGSLDGSVTGTGALVIDQIGSGITLADVDTTNGALTVTADGTIVATDVAATGGNVSLTADSGNIDVASVSGPNVTLTSTAGAIQEVAGGDVDADVTSAGVLTATAATGINLQTDVGSLDGSVTGTGDLVIDQIGSGITLADVDTSNGALAVTADGTIVATDVAATGGNVSLTADSGNIDVASVSGPNVALIATNGAIQEVAVVDAGADVTSAGTLTATAATGINLQTAVGSLDGTVTGTGALVIDQIGSGITLTDVDTSNGALTVTADGTITATDVAASGGTASLTADSGNIDVASVSGPNVTLTSTAGAIQEVVTGADAGADVTSAGTLTATAATGINLQTAVGSLDGSVTGSGGALSITESDGITLSSVDTNNGAITVTANAGNIVAGSVNAGTASVTLDADQSGGQQIRDDVSPGTENDATTRIVGGTITLLASGGIGAGDEDVDIDGASLVATTTTGALNINEANNVTLTTFTNNANGDVALSTGAAQTLSAIDVGSNNLRYVTRDAGANLTLGGTLAGGTVTLISGGAIIDGNASGPDVQATTLDASAASGIDLDTAVSNLTASGGAGAISIDQAAGDMVLTSVSNSSGGIAVNLANGSLTATDVDAGAGNINLVAGGSGSMTAGSISGGAITLSAGGAISGSGGPNVTGQSLSATSGTGGIDLDTAVASLSASAGGTGDIDIDNSTGIALTNVATNAGNIRVDAAAGDIIAGVVTAGSGGNVTLTADGAGQSIRDDGNDGAGPSRVAGNLVTLTAGTDIGSAAEDLDTAASTILATANGVINIDQLGGVSLDASNPGGAVTVTASGPMVVTGVSAAGAVSLGATGAGSGMQVASISGTDIVLNAGGAITDDGDAASDVNGSSLDATAGNGIDIDTAVDTLNAHVTGPGAIDISEADDISLGTVRTSDGPVTLAAGGDISAGTIRGDGVSIETDGDLSIRSTGQIDGRAGAVTIAAAGDVAQEPGRGTDPAIRGNSISIVAGGNVGLLTLPLSVDSGGAVAIDFSSGSAVAFITGIFGSLNESQRVLGLGSNTVLANNVGAVQSSFEERVSFKLDSSQFATETRIFSIEGTGILPPADQRE